MEGYLNNSDTTIKRIKPHPIYGSKSLYTGDYSWLDSEGFLYLEGREDDIYKMRGKKIILSEIEKAFLQISEVNECTIMALKRINIDDLILIAYVVVNNKLIRLEYVR